VVEIETPPLRSMEGAPHSNALLAQLQSRQVSSPSFLPRSRKERPECQEREESERAFQGQRDRQSTIARPLPCQENFKSQSFLAVTLGVCARWAKPRLVVFFTSRVSDSMGQVVCMWSWLCYYGMAVF